jgi:type IV pilus assembly protein PilX
MAMKNSLPLSQQHSQRGAVLIMGLVLLMALTIIGVASMSNNTLESRMAGNLTDSTLAFNAAETAARAAQATFNPDFDSRDNCSGISFDGVADTTCAIDQGDSANARADMDWMKDNPASWWATSDLVQTFSGNYTAKIGSDDIISSPPRAIIEQYSTGGGRYQQNLDRRTLTTGNKYYRITVRATGSSDNSQAMIQQIINKHR